MAAIPGSVSLTGFIAPTDSTDVFAVTKPIYGLGGLRTVSGVTERDAITTQRREVGMLVYISGTSEYYKLESGLTNSDWVLLNIGSGSSISGYFLALSGGTVTGDTYFTQGLSAFTFSAGTINSGSTNLYDIFLTIGNSGITGNFIPMSGTGVSAVTGDIQIDDATNLSWNATNETLQYNPVSTNIELTTSNGFDVVTGAILSAGTDLYAIFGTGSGSGFSGWTSSTGTNSIKLNNATNIAAGPFSLAGGFSNSATSYTSVVVGGKGNKSSGNSSFVGAGQYNQALGANSVVVGGGYAGPSYANIAAGYFSAIVGGQGNQTIAGAGASFVGGGSYNTVGAGQAVIVGGAANRAEYRAFVGGGYANSAMTNNSVVVGGRKNVSSGDYAFVGGGNQNRASGDYAFVGGGFKNSATTTFASVVGGRQNVASGIKSSVVGGEGNLASATYSFIGGGRYNSATTQYAVVVGGRYNWASADYSSIVGGTYNIASAAHSSIVGGNNNTASGARSVVLGGSGINGVSADTVYVPFLNIQSANTNNVLTNVLVRDANGDIYLRDASTLGSGSTGNFIPMSGTGANLVTGDIAIDDAVNLSWNGANETLQYNPVSTNIELTTSNGFDLVTGAMMSAGTDLYNIFLTSAPSGGTGFSGWTSSTGTYSIIANNGTANLASGNYSIVGGSGNTTSGNYSFIGNGKSNTTSGYYSFIGNGKSNTTSGYYTAVLNGAYNTAIGYNSTVLNGKNNSTYGYYSFIAGGNSNYTYGLRAAIINGISNSAMTESSFVGLGFENKAYGVLGHSIIVGGYRNRNSGGFSFIGVGSYNNISGNWSSIINGHKNTASGNYSFIGGGGGTFIVNGNSATTSFSTIVNGRGNLASGAYSFIGNGGGQFGLYSNSATTSFSTVINGRVNLASGAYSFISNGTGNTISGQRSAIIGGRNITGIANDTVYVPFLNINSATTNNALTSIVVRDANGDIYLRDASTLLTGGTSGSTGFSGWTSSTGTYSIIANNGTGNLASGTYSIAGGKQNNASGNYSFIGGGSGNTASGIYSIVVGGQNNFSSYKGVIVGGQNNFAYNTSAVVGGNGNRALTGSFVGGGVSNIAGMSAISFSVVVGGAQNKATSRYSSILGGYQNSAITNYNTTVINGRRNLASGYHSLIGSGYRNTATTRHSSVVNGYQNIITGDFSSIINGRGNLASGAYSFIGNGGLFTVNGNSATTSFATVINGLTNLASGAHSFISNGTGHTVSGTRSAIIGGRNIIGTANDTVYVPFFNIQSASTNNVLTNILVRDSNGDIYLRDASTLSGGSSGATITASNGLTKTGDNITLGGALTANTSITGLFTLNLGSGTGTSRLSSLSTRASGTTQLLSVVPGLATASITLTTGSTSFGLNSTSANIVGTTIINENSHTSHFDNNGTQFSESQLEISGATLRVFDFNTDENHFKVLYDPIAITNNGIDNRFIVSDFFGQKGIVYSGDYSSNFTPESLVTKRYVDMVASGGTTGATGNFLPISGGTVTGNTIFTTNVSASTLTLTTTSAAPLNLPLFTVNPVSPIDGDTWLLVSGGSIYLSVQFTGTTKTVQLT